MLVILTSIQSVFIALSTIWCSIQGFLLLPFGPKLATRWTSWLWSRLLLNIGLIRVKVTGLENIKNLGPAVFVSNHESSFDIPALFYAIPRPVFFIAKAELKKVPFLGWIMSGLGMIFVERGNREKATRSMQHAAEQIKKDKSVISFPEGTRTKTGKMNRFKKTTFQIAIEGDIPVVPIAIEGAYEITRPNHFEIRPFRKIQLHIGQPIATAEYKEKGAQQYAADTQSIIENMITELH